MRQFLHIGFLFTAILMGGCDRAHGSKNEQLPVDRVVRTTSWHVDALTRELVGDHVGVECLCPEDVAPSSWRPSSETIAKYQRSKLIVTNGAGWERWVERAPLPRSRVVDASGALSDEMIMVQGESHSHGPDGVHSHDVVLGTVWLDPMMAIAQADRIAESLIRAFPEHKNAIESNLNELTSEYRGHHRTLDGIRAEDVVIIAPTDPFGYLARRYGWATIDSPQDINLIRDEMVSSAIPTGALNQKPMVLLCEVLPDPKMAIGLSQAYGVTYVLWKTDRDASSDRSIDVLSSNIDRLMAAIERVSE